MRSDPAKPQPPTATWWLISIAMALTISAQVVELSRQTSPVDMAASLAITIGSSLILIYAIYRLIRTAKHNDKP